MYKLLIAEDEAIILEGIKQKIQWDTLGLQLAGTATDGIEALSVFKETRPDIVLTDIRMPGLNGLALIKQMKEIKPDTICIILSGISDFSFAREAIQLDVTNYLLKPLKEEEIHETLCNQISILDNRLEDRRVVLEWKDKFRKREETIKELDLTRYITESPAESLSQMNSAFGFASNASKFCVAIFAFGKISFPHLNFKSDEEPLLWFGVKNIIEDCLRENQLNGVVFKHAFAKREIVVFIDTTKAEDSVQVMKAAFEQALQYIERILRISSSVGLGTEADSLETLRRSYQEASSACRDRIVYGYGKIYAFHKKAVHGTEKW